MNDTRYAYAVGRIRALEKGLLDYHSFLRLSESPGPEAVLKELENSVYLSLIHI